MASRPQNHVTRDMAKRLVGQGSQCPDLSELLVAWLEEAFPPRCLAPRETVEDHLRYAGKVELIAFLRAQLVDRLEGEDTPLDPFIQPADLASQ